MSHPLKGRKSRLFAGLTGGLLLSACGTQAVTPTAAHVSSFRHLFRQRSLAAAFPQSWRMYGGTPTHNSSFRATGPAGLMRGYSWNTPELNALPLNAPAQDQSVLGARGAPVKTTQFLGNSVGVSAVKGVIYSESDMGKLYALNAKTGAQLWQASGDNSFMGNPVVAHGVVVAGAGDTGFSFSQVMKYVHGQTPVRGLGWAAIYGFNQKTGKQLWRVPTVGEDMSSLAERHGIVYEGTGDGHVLALNIHTGQQLWSTNVTGFDSMSSAAISGNLLYVGFSDPNYLYALNATTGQIVWKQTVAGVANTGMGDNSPAVDPAHNIVIQDSVVNANPTTKTMNLEAFAMNAQTGAVLWQTLLGNGPAPPAYKASISAIHGGVVYVGNPATSTLSALNEFTGKVLWQFAVPNAGPAGATRGGAIYAHHIVWLAAGPNLYALNPANGQLLGTTVGGGRYGIVTPVIVGGTMYLGNSWGWTQAVPLSKIFAGWKSFR